MSRGGRRQMQRHWETKMIWTGIHCQIALCANSAKCRKMMPSCSFYCLVTEWVPLTCRSVSSNSHPALLLWFGF
jgi:hypothetical protein